jgi:cysteine desulfurase
VSDTSELIYLDNNATTPIDPRVVAAMSEVWQSGPLNPASQHAAGRRARAMLDDAARGCAALLGADIATTGRERLVWTSGGTEANNLALDGLVPRSVPRIVSTIEHPSVLEAARRRLAEGLPTHWLSVDSRGVVDLDQLESLLGQLPSASASATALVSVMAANNETGVLQPLEELGDLCRRFGAQLHSDTTQWIGKLPFDFASSGCHAVSFAAHKFHGPVGVGGLLLAPGVHPIPSLVGGGQQLGTRGGTEAVPLAIGMQQALELAVASLPAAGERMAALRDRLEAALLAGVPGTCVHAVTAPRLPSTTNLAFPQLDRQLLLIRLDRARVACSTGSACSSGSSEPSHVLSAMGVPADQIDASLRFGVSRLSTIAEIDCAAERIIQCCNKLRSH